MMMVVLCMSQYVPLLCNNQICHGCVYGAYLQSKDSSDTQVLVVEKGSVKWITAMQLMQRALQWICAMHHKLTLVKPSTALTGTKAKIMKRHCNVVYTRYKKRHCHVRYYSPHQTSQPDRITPILMPTRLKDMILLYPLLSLNPLTLRVVEDKMPLSLILGTLVQKQPKIK